MSDAVPWAVAGAFALATIILAISLLLERRRRGSNLVGQARELARRHESAMREHATERLGKRLADERRLMDEARRMAEEESADGDRDLAGYLRELGAGDSGRSED